MGYNFLPYQENQLYLLPPSVSEWVAEESLARFVSDVVDHLDEAGRLAAFYDGYRKDGWGRAAYHPRMMVKLLMYAYSEGMTSSRRIAQRCERDVAYRYLTANQQPDFRTVSDFRKAHLCRLEALFVEVLRLCREAGLAKMGRVALDGRRVSGNAALDQNRTKEGLEEEVRRILEEAERVDAAEDRQHGKDRRGDELPEGMRTKADRLRRLREAQGRLEEAERKAREEQAEKIAEREREERESGKKKRGRKPKAPEAVETPEAKANVTDPESQILKTKKGWVQGYNGQAVADCATQVIIAQDVTQQANDVQQLGPMLTRCEEQAGQRPRELLADAGYWSEDNAALGGETTELFVATLKDHKQRKALQKSPTPRGRIAKTATLRDRMERKLLTKRGKAAYRERGKTIEPVFGQMVNRGLVRFLLRGFEKVRGEWSLWCTSHNLLKLWRSGWRPATT